MLKNSLKYVLLVGLATMIAGCPMGGVGELSPARSLITNQLRTTCWRLDDQGIEDRLALTDLLRSGGATAIELTLVWFKVCDDESVAAVDSFSTLEIQERRSDCFSCFQAMVETVFP